MRKHLGKIAAGLLVFLLVLMLALPSFINWNSYRSLIEELMSSQIGSAVTLKGDITATLLPAPRITAEKVDVPIVGTVQAIDMLLDPLSLLQGDVKPVDMTIKGARIKLTQTKAGHPSFDGFDALFGQEALISPKLDRMSVSNSTLSLALTSGDTHDIAISKLTFEERPDTGSKTIEALIISRDVPVQLAMKFQPVGTMGNLSTRVEGRLPGGSLLFSGRVDANFRPLLGRISFKGDRLDTATSNLMDALNVGLALEKAPLPFDFDFRIEEKGDALTAKSFAFSLAGSPGAATFDYHPKQGVKGSVRLGVLKSADWLGMKIKKAPGLAHRLPPLALDLLLQGVETGGQSMQQMTATLTLKDGKLAVDKMQALLPGVTAVSLTGEQQKEGGDFMGQLSLTSASPKEFLMWMGLSSLDKIDQSRLAALSMNAGRVTIAEKTITLDQLEARVDSSLIKGQITINRDDALASLIDLRFDQVTLDPYRPLLTGQGKSWPDLMADLPARLSIGTGPFILDGQSYAGGQVSLTRQGTLVTLESLEIQGQKGGFLKGQGDYGLQKQSTAERNITLTAQAMPHQMLTMILPLKKIFGGLDISQLIVGDQSDFTLKQKGTVAQRSVIVDLSHRAGKFMIDGTLTSSGEAESHALSGQLVHHDTAQLAALLGYAAFPGHQPLTATITLDTQAPSPVVVKGQSGEMTLSLALKNWPREGGQLDLRLSAPKAADFLPLDYQPYFPAGYQKPGSVDATLMVKKNGMALSLKNLALGGVDYAAQLDITPPVQPASPYQLGGSLSMTGFKENAAFVADRVIRGWSANQFDPIPVPPMTGTIALTLKEVSFLGQRYDAGQAIVSLRGTGVDVKGLSLPLSETQALAGSLSYDWGTETQQQKFMLDLTIPSLVIDHKDLLYLPLTAGQSSLAIKLSGVGNTPKDMIKSLKGSASMTLKGGNLYGLDIGAISWAARETSSYASFLKALGTWQQKGENPIEQAQLAAVIDGGAALLDGVSIVGPWGEMRVEGQVGLVARSLTMRGSIALKALPDVAPISLTLNGDVTAPAKQLDTSALEKFVYDRVASQETTALAKRVEENPVRSPVLMVYSLMLPSLRQKQQAYHEALKALMRAEQNPAGNKGGQSEEAQ